jgi:hypothetical protein
MPIRPENKGRYPKDWPAISKRIREERAGNRCEFLVDGGDLRRCEAVNGQPHPVTGSKVVLTVAHLDHTPENVGDDNLLAGCQRCHLHYDAGHHRQGRLRRAREALDTADLLDNVGGFVRAGDG